LKRHVKLAVDQASGGCRPWMRSCPASFHGFSPGWPQPPHIC